MGQLRLAPIEVARAAPLDGGAGVVVQVPPAVGREIAVQAGLLVSCATSSATSGCPRPSSCS